MAARCLDGGDVCGVGGAADGVDGVDTQCLRERLFFGVLVINFLIGFGLTLWKTVPDADVRAARVATGMLWALAGLLSLLTVGREKES